VAKRITGVFLHITYSPPTSVRFQITIYVNTMTPSIYVVNPTLVVTISLYVLTVVFCECAIYSRSTKKIQLRVMKIDSILAKMKLEIYLELTKLCKLKI